MGFNNATIDAFDAELTHVYKFESLGTLTDKVGSLDLTQSGTPTVVTGKDGNGLDYGGNSHHASSSTAANDGAKNIFWSGWFSLHTFTGAGNVATQYGSGGSTSFPQLTESSNKLLLDLNGTNISSTTSITLDTFAHFSFYINVTTKAFFLYFNGTQEASGTYTGTPTPGNFYFASRNFSGSAADETDITVDEFYTWNDLDLDNSTTRNNLVTALYNSGTGRFWQQPVIVTLTGRYDTSVINKTLTGRYDTSIINTTLTGRYKSNTAAFLTGKYRTSVTKSLTGRYNTSVINIGLTGRYRTRICVELIGRYANVGEKRFDLYLLKNDLIVDSVTSLFSAGLTLTDVFPSTPLTLGSYRIECESNEFLPNKEKNSFTVIAFSIDAGGLLITQVPNAPNFLTAEAKISGSALLRWRYDTTNQEVAPTVFNVYHNSGGGAVDYGTIVSTVTYVAGQFQYQDTLTGLTDNLTYTFGVRSANGLDEESNTNTATALIDAVPPVSQPFNFGFS